jgi:hypothetical protein
MPGPSESAQEPGLCPPAREGGQVSHDEAREILSRFNASHWKNGKECARYSIPARPEYDDDLRLAAYIAQNEFRATQLAAAELRAGRLRELVIWIGEHCDAEGDHLKTLAAIQHVCLEAIAEESREATQSVATNGGTTVRKRPTYDGPPCPQESNPACNCEECRWVAETLR